MNEEANGLDTNSRLDWHTCFEGGLRGDEAMCEALRELMADDLKEAESKGIEKRDYQKIMEMLKDGKTPEAIVEFCKYPMEQVLKVQEEMLVQK